MYRNSLAISFLLLLLPVALGGCYKYESTIKVEDYKPPGETESDKPKYVPHLPSPPPASAFVIKEKNDDGTLRVRGMIHNQEKYLDTHDEVRIKGVISYISPNCDPRQKSLDGSPCLKPNLFIKDSVDAKKSLQIVGFPFSFVKKTRLEQGQTHVFRGLYVTKSNGFVNSGDGLLELIEVDDKEVRKKK